MSDKKSSLMQIKISVGSQLDVEEELNKFFVLKNLSERDITFRRFELSFDDNGNPTVLAVIEYKTPAF